MTPKEYLKQIESLQDSIDILEDAVSKLRADVGIKGIDYSRDRVQTSSGRPEEDKIIRIIEKENRLNAVKEKYNDAISIMSEQIAGMQNADYKLLLYKKYVEVKTLEQVAVEMHFSYQYTKHMHGWALERFAQKYGNLKRFI